MNRSKVYVPKDWFDEVSGKLNTAGVTDADYIIYKQGGLDKFTFDKDGNPVGIFKKSVVKPRGSDIMKLTDGELGAL